MPNLAKLFNRLFLAVGLAYCLVGIIILLSALLPFVIRLEPDPIGGSIWGGLQLVIILAFLPFISNFVIFPLSEFFVVFLSLPISWAGPVGYVVAGIVLGVLLISVGVIAFYGAKKMKQGEKIGYTAWFFLLLFFSLVTIANAIFFQGGFEIGLVGFTVRYIDFFWIIVYFFGYWVSRKEFMKSKNTSSLITNS